MMLQKMFRRVSTTAVLWTLVSLSLLVRSAAKECVGQGQCQCTFDDDQSMIDLTSIGNSDGTARFKGVEGTDGSGTYSYNPCYPFDDGTDCSTAAACMTDTVGTTQVIGNPQPVQWNYDGSNLYVGYDAGSGILTVTTVQLVCDPSACTPALSVAGDTGTNKYGMTLTTVCACPNGCDSSGPTNCTPSSSSSSGGIGGGAIFLIIFFTLIVVYFVGGTLFMKFGRKASGAEVIPNVNFWKSVPSLVKGGCLFILKPLRRDGYTKH